MSDFTTRTHNSTAIAFKDVYKSYVIETQRIDALRAVSFTAPQGSRIAVTGKSGAGKSTLLHIIGTLDRPSQGQVFLNGTDVSVLSDAAASAFRNSSVGFVFQMNNLLPEFSACENVMMPGLIAGFARGTVQERANKLLDMVGLAARLNHRPSELSGGEQQRVAIARALLMAPPILLCDEPTGNLDKRTSGHIQELLLSLAEQLNMTMVLVTHDLELASRLPHRLIMEDGMIVESSLT